MTSEHPSDAASASDPRASSSVVAGGDTDAERTESLAIKERVRLAFQDQQALAYAPDFLQTLRSTMKDIADSTRRSTLLGLLVAAMFELINQALITDVQVGPFRIERLALVQRALPVLYAYFAYDAAVQILEYRYCRVAHLELMSITHSSIRAMDLDRLLYPRSSSLFGPLLLRTESRLYPLLYLFTIFIRAGAVISGAGVGCYMLYRLFSTFGTHDVVTWLSALLSVGFAAYAFTVYLFAQSLKVYTLVPKPF